MYSDFKKLIQKDIEVIRFVANLERYDYSLDQVYSERDFELFSLDFVAKSLERVWGDDALEEVLLLVMDDSLSSKRVASLSLEIILQQEKMQRLECY